MSNQRKEKQVLEVVVLISKEDRTRAVEFLVKQELHRRTETEENQVNGNGKDRSLMKQKMVSPKKLKKEGKQKPVFICDYCQTEFSYSSHLKLHVTVHTGQKDFHCNLCDYSCSQKGNLQDHIRRRHLNERPFKCQEPNCEATFKEYGKLKVHQFVHNKSDKRFSCSFCSYKSNQKGNLIQHTKNTHSEFRPFKCPHENCDFSAKQKGNLKTHLKIHSGKKNQVCPHPNCGFKTNLLKHLKSHMKIHLNEENGFKCHFCDFSSHHHGNLIVHIRQHRGETDELVFKQELQRLADKEENQVNGNGKDAFFMNQKMVSPKKFKKEGKQKPVFVCDYCQKQFSYSSHLKQHVKIHTGQRDFRCNLCDFSCAYKGNLVFHIRSHLKERPFKCQQPNCEAAFTQAVNLKTHQLVHNNKKDKRFSCSACPYKTNRKGSLAQHMKNIHSESRPFKCPQENCDFSAKQKSNLIQHLKIHSGKKRKCCPHLNCGFETKLLSDLKLHMKIHPSGVKKFKCRFCDFSSHFHGSLVVHIRRHTGETPFSCQLCPFKSKQQGHLDQHMKNH